MPGQLVVILFEAAAVLGAVGYFRRWRLERPPTGAINRRDVVMLIGAVVSLPFIYLALPVALVILIGGAADIGIIYIAARPVLSSPWAGGFVAVGMVATNVSVCAWFGVSTPGSRLMNDLMIVILVVGVSNLWVQSGLRASHAAMLAVALSIYDLVATAFTDMTVNLLDRLSALPFAPMITWSNGPATAGIGIGDVLVAAVVSLVMRKAYGRAAGCTTVILLLVASCVMLALISTGHLPNQLPAMTVFGPVTVLLWICWRHRRPERTTQTYLNEEPLRRPRAGAKL